uniref:hypothetical chloroplast RF66 n=1 Tax=Streptofilum capillatum TaxID=2058781 RepID=UPI00286A6EC9|nr:hypothetical chloroplast RF66 [Streptofilum capillatum]WKT08551.1 hypothetical chloroplast RF66 [Streptofilum capillatum]WKT08650.1 hypothetical chloroplast RF66 [Streptofilum sp. BC4-VF8pt]WKT08748.1 hypothetical chloroplast RF66 [Streptofilum sp. ZNP2-VF4pt]
MINIEFGPSTVLGIALVIGAIALYVIRAIEPEICREYDVFFCSLKLLSGGILIFQGWRLDPILLFCQMICCFTAIFFIWESIRLRRILCRFSLAENRAKRLQNDDSKHSTFKNVSSFSHQQKILLTDISDRSTKNLVKDSQDVNDENYQKYTKILDYSFSNSPIVHASNTSTDL